MAMFDRVGTDLEIKLPIIKFKGYKKMTKGVKKHVSIHIVSISINL